jgi:hypothetical protein
MTFLQNVYSKSNIYVFQSCDEVLTRLYRSDKLEFFKQRYEFLDENLKDKQNHKQLEPDK